MPPQRSIQSFFATGNRFSPLLTLPTTQRSSRSPSPARVASPGPGPAAAGAGPATAAAGPAIQQAEFPDLDFDDDYDEDDIEPEPEQTPIGSDFSNIDAPFHDEGLAAPEHNPVMVDVPAEENDDDDEVAGPGLFQSTLDNPHVLPAPIVIPENNQGSILQMFLQTLVWSVLASLTLAQQVLNFATTPHHNGPGNRISLREWLQNWEALDTLIERTKFVVFGHDKALSFEAPDDVDTPGTWSWTWDIDSILYTFSEYTLNLNVKYYPFPNRNSTLRFNNHLSIPETIPTLGKRAFLSQIPNMVLASGGPGNNIWINIFFPGMRRKKGNRWVNYVSNTKIEYFYDRLFKPALMEVAPATWESYMNGLPTDYTAAQERARNPNGTFASVGTQVPGVLFRKAMAKVRERVENDADAAMFKGFFYHLYVKGIKNTTSHPIVQPLDIMNDPTWGNLLHDCKNPTDLLVDTGINLTFNAQDGTPITLLWSRLKLARLLHSGGWKAPTVDEWCHTRDVAGLRAVPKEEKSSKGHVAYVQAYHGEKNLTYIDAERNLGLKFSQSDLLLNTNRYRTNIDNLKNAFVSQIGRNFHARFELRLTFEAMKQLQGHQAPNWLVENLQACLFKVPSSLVARFKLAMLSAWDHVATSMATHLSWDEKRKWEHIRLADMCQLMIRGLVVRQDDDSASRRIMRGTHMSETYGPHGRALANPAFVKLADFKIIFDKTEEVKWAQRKARTHLAFGQTNRHSTTASGSGPAPALAAAVPLDELSEEQQILLPWEDSILPVVMAADFDNSSSTVTPNGAKVVLRQGNVEDMEPWAEFIFYQCRRDLWACTLRDYLLLPYQEGQMVFESAFFNQNIQVEWVGTGKSVSNILSWYKIFRYLFPDEATEAVGTDPKNRQRAWTNMKYRERYQNLAQAVDESRDLLDALLWRKFLAGDAAPAVSKERPWKATGRVRIIKKHPQRIGQHADMTAALAKYGL